MLNRNDRVALKRNRNAVTLLFILCIFLLFWIKSLYSDIDHIQYEKDSLNQDFYKLEQVSKIRKKEIDSLITKLNYKEPSDTTPKKFYKPVVDKSSVGLIKQTTMPKIDTVSEDSLKSN